MSIIVTTISHAGIVVSADTRCVKDGKPLESQFRKILPIRNDLVAFGAGYAEGVSLFFHKISKTSDLFRFCEYDYYYNLMKEFREEVFENENIRHISGKIGICGLHNGYARYTVVDFDSDNLTQRIEDKYFWLKELNEIQINIIPPKDSSIEECLQIVRDTHPKLSIPPSIAEMSKICENLIKEIANRSIYVGEPITTWVYNSGVFHL